MTTRTPTTTEENILDAALRAIAQVGLRGLSITEICREAQISRGTVYRYFRSRAQVLEFLGEHMVGIFEHALATATAADPNIENRFYVVFETMFGQREHPLALQMTEVEPEFLLTFFKKEFPRLVRISEKALGTALDESPLVRSGVLTGTQVAELMLRISISASVLPEGGSEDFPSMFRKLWSTAAGTPDSPSSPDHVRCGTDGGTAPGTTSMDRSKAPGMSTVDRLLNGALRAIARRGPQKLSMSDVCDEAGVSRGTLYRYFKNKNEVLLAISAHVRDESRAAIDRAIAADPAPERRLYVVLDAMVHYRETHPEAVLAIEAEPAFALQWLRRTFPGQVTFLDEALDPVFNTLPAVQAGGIARPALAELFLRIVISIYLIPTADGDTIPVWLTDMWGFMTAHPGMGQRPARTTRVAS